MSSMELAVPAAPRRAAVDLGVALALAAVWIIWGSTYFVVGLALHSFPPLLLAGVRLTLAGVLLLVVARASRLPMPTRAEWRSSALLGVLLLVLGHGAVVFAQQWVQSSLAALAAASIPLFAALWSWAWGTRPGRAESVALGLGFLGIVVLGAGGVARVSVPGLIFLLVANLSWSLGTVWRVRLPSPPGVMAPAAQMLVAGPVLLAAALVRGETMVAVPDARALAALAYLTVFGSMVAFSAYNYLLVRVRPTVASSSAWVNPLLAVFIGAALGGERIGPVVWISGALVLSAVALLVGRPRR